MPKKSIIIFTAFYPPHLGGVEKYSHNLAINLQKIGFDVSIVTSNTEGLPPKESVDCINIYRLPVYNIIHGRFPIPKHNREYKALIKDIDEIPADYYLMNMRFYPLSYLGANLGRKKKKMTILIEHTTGHFTVNNKIFDFLGHIYEHTITKLIKSKVDHFMGVSGACNKWLGHFGIKASGILYNGVETVDLNTNMRNINKALSIPDNKIIFSFAGRLIEEKGIKLLLRAFERISNDYPEAFLYIAGDGPLLGPLKEQYNNNKSIEFGGRLSHDETMNLLDISSSVIIPSYYPEGLPTLILEAGLHKCALITTPMGGSEEVINDPGLGIIIRENSEAAIYDAIKDLLDNPEKIPQLSQSLRERIINKFSWNKIARDFKIFLSNK